MVIKKNLRVLKKKSHPLTVVLESKLLKEALLFQSTSILSLYPKEVESLCKSYDEVAKAHGCLGVLCTNQEDEVLKYLVLVTGCINVARLGEVEIYRLTQVSFIGLTSSSKSTHVTDLAKLLSSGHFYFSFPGDSDLFSLTNSAQQHCIEPVSDFTWNRSMLRYLTDFGVSIGDWCFKIICGSVELKTVYVGAEQVKAVLLSRLSCERAGTRFNVRGVDDEGHVANFVETEQLVYRDDAYASFVQIRGTLPVFWDQSSTPGRGSVTLSRGFECSHPAFERHCAHLVERYGQQMFINLLGSRGSDQLLAEAYQDHYDQSSHKDHIELVSFDYHRYVSSSSKLDKMISPLYKKTEGFLQRHGLFFCQKGIVVCKQSGTLRTNCLDCLDRTNVTQTYHGMEMLRVQLKLLGIEEKMYSRFMDAFTSCWEKNGDSLSWIYAGSGALKKTSKLVDGSRSVQRAIQNKFSDSSKQEAINKLLSSYAYLGELGRQTRSLLSSEDAFTAVTYRKSLIERFTQYTRFEPCRVAVGTWNVNGGKHFRSIAFKQSSLMDWLVDPYKDLLKAADSPVDIFAIGFEELVDLKASSLVHTSSTNRREWGAELERILSQNTSYLLLTAEQMVGICLYIFVRPHLVPFIRDVSVSTVKTGLRNRAGNKGAVAIRFLLHGTSVCFVCAHLAAHQSHVQERNSDFQEIVKKISFNFDHTLDTQDYVFWCGDLNYRIDLGIDECKANITSEAWGKLSTNDQLNKEKKAGRIFQGFSEGVLSFAPTYKYDQFSDDYDTSEKGRIPAWTDRVLWKRRRQVEYSLFPKLPPVPFDPDVGRHPSDVLMTYGEDLKTKQPYWNPGKLMFYGRAELKTSDHRPVIAVFDIEVLQLMKDEYVKVRGEVLRELGPADQTIVVSSADGKDIDTPCLLREVMKFGGIVLMRETKGEHEITLHDSRGALEALSLDGKECNEVTLKVRLRSPFQVDKLAPERSPVPDNTLQRSSYLNISETCSEDEPTESNYWNFDTDLIQDSSDEEGGTVPDESDDVDDDGGEGDVDEVGDIDGENDDFSEDCGYDKTYDSNRKDCNVIDEANLDDDTEYLKQTIPRKWQTVEIPQSTVVSRCPVEPPRSAPRGHSIGLPVQPQRAQTDSVVGDLQHDPIPMRTPSENVKKSPPPRPSPPGLAIAKLNTSGRVSPPPRPPQPSRPSRPPPPKQTSVSKLKPSRPPQPTATPMT